MKENTAIENRSFNYLYFLIPAVFLGYLILASQLYYSKKQQLEGDQIKELQLDVKSIKVKLLSVIENSKELIEFQSLNKIVISSLEKQKANQELIDYYNNLLNIYDKIFAVRLINLEGQEIFHMSKVNEKNTVFKQERLQNKKNRSYFQQIENAQKGQVIVSEINLNREFGVLDFPERPTIRFMIAVYSNTNKKLGYLTLNFHFHKLIKDIETLEKENKINILNQNGYWIYGNKEKNFAYEYSGRNHLNIVSIHPYAWRALKKEQSFSKVDKKARELLYFHKFELPYSGNNIYLYDRKDYTPILKELNFLLFYLISFFFLMLTLAIVYIKISIKIEKEREKNLAQNDYKLSIERWINLVLLESRNSQNIPSIIKSMIRLLKELEWHSEDPRFVKIKKYTCHFKSMNASLDSFENIICLEDQDNVFRIYADQAMPFFFDDTTHFGKANQSTISIPLTIKNKTFGIFLIPTKRDFDCDNFKMSIIKNFQEILNNAFDNIYLNEEISQEKLNNIDAKKFASLGNMAGGIAHEINNPLAIINGFVPLLTKQVEKEKREALSQKILTQIDRINELTKTMLTLSEGKNHANRELISIKEIFQETEEAILKKYPQVKESIQFTTSQVKPDFDTFTGNKFQIQKSVLKLVENALDAVEGKQDGWVRIESKKTPKNMIITVTDNGHGIEESIFEKITDPFFTTKEIGKGEGLGLSFVRNTCDAHLGELDYGVDKNGNTFFSISIPTVNSQQSA